MTKFLGKLIDIDTAIEKAVSTINDLGLDVVETSIWESVGRVSAEDVEATVDQPRYDRSAVDGYCVKAEDTYGSTPNNPAKLVVKGSMKPGDPPDKYSIGYGEAVEVSTGTPIPPGCDAVVMAEDVGHVDKYIEIYRPVPRYANISRRGEDYRVGETIVSRNKLLKPWDLAIIASSGYDKIRVYEKIRVGLICSGSEIVEPGQLLGVGQIYNSTGVLVKNYLDMISFIETHYYGVYPDQENVLEEALSKALEENHVVITCGGAGVSGVDVVRDIVGEKGVYVFRGVAMRPGRPTSLAVIDGKPVFMLSGYPVAAWTGLEALFKPIIYRLMGLDQPVNPSVEAFLVKRVPNTIGYRSYIRVRLWREDGRYFVEPYMLKGSGILSSLTRSNAYIVIHEDLEGYEAGDKVVAYLL